MNELSLFSGAGGGLLASRWLLGHRIVGYVEKEWYRAKSIHARIEDGLLDDAPIRGDIRYFDGTTLRGAVDVISAGFPCTPFSVAGKNLGGDDERNEWPSTLRVIRQVRPRFVFLENSPNLLVHSYFGTILGDLAEAGFDAEWTVLSAADCGANHIRKRLWVLAYSEPVNACRVHKGSNEALGEDLGRPSTRPRGKRTAATGALPYAERSLLRLQPGRREADGPCAAELGDDGEEGNVADADERDGHRGSGDLQVGRVRIEKDGSKDVPARGAQWSVEPDVGRVAHGVASRVDRLAALGDGQVPLVAALAFRLLMSRIATSGSVGGGRLD